MIRKLEVRNFKRFRDATFEFDDQIIIVGPNNCGKTTVLQAIALWSEAWHHWLQDEDASGWLRRDSGSEMRTRQGYVTTRLETIHTLAVTDFAHLWHDNDVRDPIVLAMHTNEWKVALELHFDSGTLTTRIADTVSRRELRDCAFAPLSTIYVPSTLRIKPTESVFEEDVLRARLPRGRGASVLRNILLRLSESKEQWIRLTNAVLALFDYEIKRPSRREPLGIFYRHSDEDSWLELACAGSGFLQVLLLISISLYNKPQVVMIDEPDMHLHRLLQNRVYDLLPRLQGSQIIASSHSDVFIDAADLDHLRSVTNAGLVGVEHPPPPSRHDTQAARRPLKDALLLTNSDIHTAVADERILYVEGKTDIPILRAWARAIGHPVLSFLEKPFWRPTSSRKKEGVATRHYKAIKTIVSAFRGIELCDRNRRKIVANDGDNSRGKPRTPPRIYWRRYEIENYLLQPDVMLRFIEKRGADEETRTRAEEYMKRQWPPVLQDDPLADSVLDRNKGKETIAELMEDVGLSWKNSDCVYIAEVMKPEEVHSEVREKLDRIAEELELTESHEQ